MRSSPMDNAAALLDSIPSTVSADNANGMRSTTKDSESAESLVMPEESSISPVNHAFAFLSTSILLMEHAESALFNQLMILSPRNASAMMASSRTSIFAPLLAILMKDSSMENASARMDIILLDTHAVFAHLLLAMIQSTESADLHARLTKFGMPPLDHADAFQDTTSLVESALNAMLRLKFTTKNFNAVIASMVIKKFQDKVAMEFADLSAVKIKIGFQEDVYANPDSSYSTTSAQLALLVKSMISMREYAEYNAEAIKSTTSTVENAIALKDFILFKVPAPNVLLVNHMMSTLKLAQLFPVKEPINSTAPSLDNVSANLNMLELEESAITVLLDIIMIATLINAFASLGSDSLVDSVNLFVHLTKPTSMENANAIMDFL